MEYLKILPLTFGRSTKTKDNQHINMAKTQSYTKLT